MIRTLRTAAAAVFALGCADSAGPSDAARKETISAAVSRTTITDLGTLGGSSSEAYAINDNGEVVGLAQTGGGATHGFFRTAAGTMVDLGTLGGVRSAAYGVTNLAGSTQHVAGEATNEFNNVRAVVWTVANGLVVDTVNLGPGGTWAINDLGQVAGLDSSAGSRRLVVWTAALTSSGTTVTLEAAGREMAAFDLNNDGLVVGSSDDGAAWWSLTDAGDVKPLHYLDGSLASGRSVNVVGVIGGGGSLGGGLIRAFRWPGPTGARTQLGTLGNNAYGFGINDAGHVVGHAHTTRLLKRAALWRADVAMDLGALRGAKESQARAINNRGQIVGWSRTNSGSRAMLWIP